MVFRRTHTTYGLRVLGEKPTMLLHQRRPFNSPVHRTNRWYEFHVRTRRYPQGKRGL